MAVEPKRGCGFRKVGGTYLVSDGAAVPCDRLPIQLDVCPVCAHGFKQSRGWTWVELAGLVGGKHLIKLSDRLIELSTFEEPIPSGWADLPADAMLPCPCDVACPLCKNPEEIGKAGLMWIGAKFYKTPDEFMREGRELGISRRIKAVPRNFKVGQTWIMLAHPKTIQCANCHGAGVVPASANGSIVPRPSPEADDALGLPSDWERPPIGADVIATVETEKCKDCKATGYIPGIFTLWRPSRVETIFKESDRNSEEVQKAREQGITPVFVPDDDKDHIGTVYDKDNEEETESEIAEVA